MDPILKEIQIGHKTRTTHANNLFEGVNYIVFLRLTDEKKTTTTNSMFFVELWSNPFIFFCTASIYGHVFGP
jgi:hypothetical protein